MANIMIGFPNRTDSATLSGGSWSGSLPLTNLQDRTLGKKARSANLLAASTKFDIDLGASKKIRLIGLIAHNLSLAATYRLRGSTVSNFATTVYDSAWLEVWPVVYPYQTLDWEDDNWWSGKYTAEQLAGVNWNLIVVLPTNKLARYWRLELLDADNTAGYIEAGRLFIGGAWQPKNNASYGMGTQWETPTTVQTAISGAEYFQRRNPARVVRFSFDWLSVDEGLGNAYEVQRRAGIDGEVLYVFDPDDTVHAIRRRFLGRMRQLNAIEHPYPLIHKVPVEIKELL